MYRLLIVDNEPNIVKGLNRLLQEHSERLGLEVLCAIGADEAMRWSEQGKLDVMLTDICMPGITGLELHLKIAEQWPECKVIFLSGYNDFHYIQTAIRQGGADYILKMEDDRQIITSVEKALSSIAESRETPKRPGEAEQDEYTHGVAERINRYIQEHLDGDLSLTRLADEVHLNPTYLCRLYKQLTGIGLSDKITEMRITKATDLLLHSHLKIHEIAQHVGLFSASYFTRCFKRHTQLTPHEFRERRGAAGHRRPDGSI